MASAFNSADIAAKKQELGYPADISNLAYIQASHKLEDVIAAFNSFTGKNYVVSFEPTGLLFMGLTPLNQFNGNDQFVALTEIGAIAHRDEAVFNGHEISDAETLVLDSLAGEHTEHQLYTSLSMADWVAADVANVNAIIDGYNQVG
ncbi:hypothetical protein [Weissella cibaria]|uniref:Uncharacterized protein n=1 Tax=Weissella cibaria TaxID=137591 RepID=A0A2S1KSB9_9LACO|nr:hypothetical protein [Weissella cibaria]AWF95895.1 hypothetical protein B6254_1501 [Weissella cibaria]